ncbi:UNVERIFIED_CONTAM: hypothetical protein FKN15_025968 [Acipenser sinensis]
MEGWRNGCVELEDLLGGLEDQGWCLTCGVYGHMVAICPFQDEEEELAQERKVGRRIRKRRGRGKLQQQQQPQQQQEDDDGWDVYIVNLVVELCPGCGAYGPTLAICPTQYEGGESKHPAPRGGEHEHPAPRGGEHMHPAPRRGEPVHPVPRRGEPVHPTPRPPAAEEEYLLPLSLPPPPLPPAGAEQRELPLPPPPPPPGAEQRELHIAWGCLLLHIAWGCLLLRIARGYLLLCIAGEPPVTGYKGEVELPLPPLWPGAPLPRVRCCCCRRLPRVRCCCCRRLPRVRCCCRLEFRCRRTGGWSPTEGSCQP